MAPPAIWRHTSFSISMRAMHAELDDVLHRRFFWPVGEYGQGVAGDGTVGSRPLHGGLDGLVLFHQRHSPLEVAVLDVALGDGPGPEPALLLRAAAEGQDDRQGDLSLAEIIAHGLAEM